MSKAYQTITAQGLVIPPALCASTQLGQLGDKVLLEIEPGRIAIRPALLSAAEAKRHALWFVLTKLGDALTFGLPVLREHDHAPVWVFTVRYKASHELCGELRIHAENGEVAAWLPAPESAGA